MRRDEIPPYMFLLRCSTAQRGEKLSPLTLSLSHKGRGDQTSLIQFPSRFINSPPLADAAVNRTIPRIMQPLQKHLRNTFLTGIFAAIPLAATAFVIWYVEKASREITSELLGINIPFLGIVIALASIYLLGLIVGSIVGKFFLNLIDRLLLRVPLLKDLYQAWKHISITPGGKEGIFAKVVLVADETGNQTLGFSSGEGIENDPTTTCVFIPAAPNPTNGRLYFVPLSRCRFVDVTVEEAFKLIISGGNYVPPGIAAASPQPSTAA